MNVLGKHLIGDFENVLKTIEEDSSIKAAVIISGKEDFMAGADITMFNECKDAEDLANLSRAGQNVMMKVEQLSKKKPVVSAINGVCLGGGLELVLATSYRLATRSKKTKLGVPEVKLGLLPGAGGTQRLPKVVGLQQGMTMMLQGSFINADKAVKMGLVNGLVEPAALESTAIQCALDLASGKLVAKKKQKSLLSKFLEDNPIGRHILFDQAKKTVDKATGGHYPAPYAIFDVLKESIANGEKAGYEKEATEFGRLGQTNASKALQGIFFSETATRKHEYGKPSRPINTVGILGAGLMGAGIAQVSTVAGLNVILKDKDLAGVTRGEKAVSDNLDKLVKRKRMTAFEKEKACARVVGLTDEHESWKKHMARSDAVIEAVFEDINVKQKVVKDMEEILSPQALIATNTSAIPVGLIASKAQHPERILGMHYFSPVDKMPLLEIIPHAKTSNDAIASAIALGQKQKKTIIVVKDVPGFFVNRCLGPYMSEGMALAQGGVSPERLDSAMKSYGFPVGPVTLMDEVGIDVAYKTFETLKDALGDRMKGSNPDGLKELVDRKFLGRKTGKGFFLYETDPKKAKQAAKLPKQLNPEILDILKKYPSGETGLENITDAEIQERMMMRFVKECILCLQDGIIRSAGDGDVGAVFGIGFPPFLGGPFRYTDLVGPQKVLDIMQKYTDKVGPQFAPPQLLIDIVKAGKKFHE